MPAWLSRTSHETEARRWGRVWFLPLCEVEAGGVFATERISSSLVRRWHLRGEEGVWCEEEGEMTWSSFVSRCAVEEARQQVEDMRRHREKVVSGGAYVVTPPSLTPLPSEWGEGTWGLEEAASGSPEEEWPSEEASGSAGCASSSGTCSSR